MKTSIQKKEQNATLNASKKQTRPLMNTAGLESDDRASIREILSKQALQPKLKISQPNDKYEQEADRIAEMVLRMAEADVQRKPTSPIATGPSCKEELIQKYPLSKQVDPVFQLQPSKLEKEKLLQTKENPETGIEVGSDISSRIESLKGGVPLPKSTLSYFNPRFGYDFNQVRVYSNSQASELAGSLNARAFTVGQKIVFGAGRYHPTSLKNKKLLAHELTHIIQQNDSHERQKHLYRENIEKEPSKRKSNISDKTGNELANIAIRMLNEGANYKILLQIFAWAKRNEEIQSFAIELSNHPHEEYSSYLTYYLMELRSGGGSKIFHMVREEFMKADAFKMMSLSGDKFAGIAIRELNRGLSEVSYKILVQLFSWAKRNRELRNFALILYQTPSDEYGTYLNCFLAVIRFRGSENLVFMIHEDLKSVGLFLSKAEELPESAAGLTGAGIGSIIVYEGKTLVQLGGMDFYISGKPPAGTWVPPGGSTSVLFVYPKNRPGKMYRLDYDILKEEPRLGTKGWEHNLERGARGGPINEALKLRVSNHQPAGGWGRLGGRTIQVFKWGGRVVFFIGMATHGVEIYYALDRRRAIAKAIASLGGAAGGAVLGARGGAIAGGRLGIPGLAIGTFAGAAGGGYLGAEFSSAIAAEAYDLAVVPLEKEEWIMLPPDQVEPVPIQVKVQGQTEEKEFIQRKAISIEIKYLPEDQVFKSFETTYDQFGKKLKKSSFAGSKFRISQQNDKYELEADLVADKIMRISKGEDDQIQIKKSEGANLSSSGNLQSHFQLLKGSGQPLANSDRSFFEPHLEYDFRNVRVHTDAAANEAAKSVNAKAFTIGTDIAFRNGEYNPESSEGRQLLAHELTHVVQQGIGITHMQKTDLSNMIFNSSSLSKHKDNAAPQNYIDNRHGDLPEKSIVKLSPLNKQQVQRRVINEEYSTAGYETGPLWDVYLKIWRVPEEDTEYVNEFVLACENGVKSAILMLGSGKKASSRTIKIEVPYRDPLFPGYVEEQCRILAINSVLKKPDRVPDPSRAGTPVGVSKASPEIDKSQVLPVAVVIAASADVFVKPSISATKKYALKQYDPVKKIVEKRKVKDKWWYKIQYKINDVEKTGWILGENVSELAHPAKFKFETPGSSGIGSPFEALRGAIAQEKLEPRIARLINLMNIVVLPMAGISLPGFVAKSFYHALIEAKGIFKQASLLFTAAVRAYKPTKKGRFPRVQTKVTPTSGFDPATFRDKLWHFFWNAYERFDGTSAGWLDFKGIAYELKSRSNPISKFFKLEPLGRDATEDIVFNRAGMKFAEWIMQNQRTIILYHFGEIEKRFRITIASDDEMSNLSDMEKDAIIVKGLQNPDVEVELQKRCYVDFAEYASKHIELAINSISKISKSDKK